MCEIRQGGAGTHISCRSPSHLAFPLNLWQERPSQLHQSCPSCKLKDTSVRDHKKYYCGNFAHNLNKSQAWPKHLCQTVTFARR